MTAIAQLPHIKPQLVHIKSKYGAEFRRFAIQPLDEEKTKSLLKSLATNPSTLLSPSAIQKQHMINKNNSDILKSSRSQTSQDSQNSSKSDQRKMVRLGGITFCEFQKTVAKLHKLETEINPIDNTLNFKIFYSVRKTGSLLPINNDDNLAKAISSCQETDDSESTNNLLRLFIYNSSQQHLSQINSLQIGLPHNTQVCNLLPTVSGNGPHDHHLHHKELSNLDTLLPDNVAGVTRRKGLAIGSPVNFRPVSAIIDVDVLPATLRRVRLHKHKSDRPLGFFIRDGGSLKMGPNGLEKVPAIFISRLVKDGLASMTGLLSVNDEVLEVNGIDVSGKTLDQVTHMMVANSENLIITVKPVNQKNNPVRSSRSVRSHNTLHTNLSNYDLKSHVTNNRETRSQIHHNSNQNRNSNFHNKKISQHQNTAIQSNMNNNLSNQGYQNKYSQQNQNINSGNSNYKNSPNMHVNNHNYHNNSNQSPRNNSNLIDANGQNGQFVPRIAIPQQSRAKYNDTNSDNDEEDQILSI